MVLNLNLGDELVNGADSGIQLLLFFLILGHWFLSEASVLDFKYATIGQTIIIKLFYRIAHLHENMTSSSPLFSFTFNVEMMKSRDVYSCLCYVQFVSEPYATAR